MTSEKYKELTKNEFNKIASKYEGDQAGIYKICKKDYLPILEEIEKLEFEKLLDAGCGSAPMISLLKEKYPDKEYTGIDLSANMIKEALSKNLDNVEFLIGDCEDLPFKDDSFDVVINSQSFHHYPNPEKFFKSVARVLKKDGKFIMRDNTASRTMLWVINNIGLPLANMAGYGDVKMHSLKEVEDYCNKANLEIEKLEKQKCMRLHLVARKR